MTKTKSTYLALTALVLSPMTANAVPIFYTSTTADSSAFDSAAAVAGIGLTVDGYEDLGTGLIDYGTNLGRTDYDIDAATDSSGIALRSIDSSSAVIEGNISMILFNSTDPLTFTFGAAISAFGITFNDIDMNFGGEFTVSIDGGAAQTLLSDGDGNDLQYFFGVIDTGSTFSSIAFDRTDGDGYYFDIVNYDSVSVPEPGSLALLGIGLAGIGLARRRRKV